MKNVALASAVLGLTVAASPASAQCPPGSWLCADITIGTVPPPPPVVYVQPPPPPPVLLQPPPRVVVLSPPPPVVVYQQARPMYVATYQPQVMYAPRPRRTFVGLQGHLTGAFMGGPSGPSMMGGLGAGLRLRGRGHFGGEFNFDVVHGADYNHDERTEVPFTLTGLFYFNPQHRFQLYALAGLGLSFAGVHYAPENVAAHGGLTDAAYSYLGVLGGLGAELQLSRRFSLFADVRGFLRGRIDGDRDTNPEFARTTSSGATQTTNSSGGVATQLGAVVYF